MKKFSNYFFILVGLLSIHCSVLQPIVKATLSQSLKTSSFDKVAVIVQCEKIGTRRCVETEFIKGLFLSGYKVASRSDFDLLARELKFQASGITDNDAVAAAKFLSVPVLFVVTVYPEQGRIGARLIDGSTSEVLWLASVSKPIYVNKGVGPFKLQTAGEDGNFEDAKLYRYNTNEQGIGTWADFALTLAQRFPARKSQGTLTEPLSGCTSSALDNSTQPLKKIVTIIRGSQINTAIECDIQNALMSGLMKKGFAIPARSDIDAALSELKLQNSGMTDDGATEIGKFLNTSVLMDISVNLIDREETVPVANNNNPSRYLTCVNARLIGVESGELLWVGSVYGEPVGITRLDDGYERREAIVNLTKKLLILFPVGPAGVIHAAAETSK
jgi:hypothetical protein